MKIGKMNNPTRNVESEIRLAHKQGFTFIDLTLEMDKSHPKDINCASIKKLTKKLGMDIVGHTGWDIPWNSPYKSVRKVALEEFMLCLEAFKKMDVKLMNIHLMPLPSIFSDKQAVAWYSETLTPLIRKAKKLGIKIMIEHIFATKRHLEVLDALLKKHPSLLLHIDVGHANVSGGAGNGTEYLMSKYHKRVAHVHLSDNHGNEDEHLGLGKGNINWKSIAKTFKKYNYDGTFTLETFHGKKDLIMSKKKWASLMA